jgi:hypothetical protein
LAFSRKLVINSKAIVERVQKGLRDRVLEVVGGGHRRLETTGLDAGTRDGSFEGQKYVPGIRVDIEEEEQATEVQKRA